MAFRSRSDNRFDAPVQPVVLLDVGVPAYTLLEIARIRCEQLRLTPPPMPCPSCWTGSAMT
jgi:hypothetical protein